MHDVLLRCTDIKKINFYQKVSLKYNLKLVINRYNKNTIGYTIFDEVKITYIYANIIYYETTKLFQNINYIETDGVYTTLHDHLGVIYWEIVTNTTFTVPLFMFTLTTFIIIFNEK